MTVEKEKATPYGLYIHIPFCRSKCKYCAFVSTDDFSLQKSYVETLISEIESYTDKGISVDTVYIGGGTPSCLYRGALYDIVAATRKAFDTSYDAEITVECNPESVDDGFSDECRRCGINRISMGLQSSNNASLKEVGRIHTYERYVSAVRLLRGSFDNISSDMILGLPHQDEADISRAINTFAEYCSHVSVYALSVENGTPLYKSGYAPNDDRVAELYDNACELLRGRGFTRYEVSNFSLPNKQSRHNNKYWECLPYIGIGVAAHGYDGEYKRYAHGDDIAEYLTDPTPKCYTLTEKDRYNEYVMLRLRTERGIDLCDFSERFGFSFADRNQNALERLKRDGCITETDGRMFIAPKYMFVMNGIIEDLMLD